jgi:hypothetical protein
MRGDHVSSVEVRGTESQSEARSVTARTFETINESVPSSRVIKGHQGSSGVIAGTFETINESVPSSRVIKGHQGSSRVIRGHQGSSGVIARTFETMNESVPTLGGEALLYMPKGELPSRFVVACIA